MGADKLMVCWVGRAADVLLITAASAAAADGLLEIVTLLLPGLDDITLKRYNIFSYEGFELLHYSTKKIPE